MPIENRFSRVMPMTRRVVSKFTTIPLFYQIIIRE